LNLDDWDSGERPARAGAPTDGSITYNTPNVGGIYSDKIIYTTLKERLTDILTTIRTSIANALAQIAAHINQPLGPGVHPMPTAAQVGAAPASHVGMALGLPGSHPATVTSDTGGFEVVQSGAGSKSNYAFDIRTNGQANPKLGITHDGDIYSALTGAISVAPNQSEATAAGAGTLTAGAMTYLALLARVVAQHVNAWPNRNPHGTPGSDVNKAYVDTQDASFHAYPGTHGCLAKRVKPDQNPSLSLSDDPLLPRLRGRLKPYANPF
jgi:hypothetical protein